MRLEPTKNWINAIVLLHQNPSPIVAPNAASGTTRCYLIEAVGPDAAKEGFKPGDVVVAKSVWDLLFYNGNYHRATFQTDEVIQRVQEASLDQFVLLDGTTSAKVLEEAAA